MENNKDLEALYNVLMSAKIYLAVKSTPKNPFVKSFGKDSTQAEQETLEILRQCVDEAQHLIPEIMSEIEQEEKEFIEKMKGQTNTE